MYISICDRKFTNNKKRKYYINQLLCIKPTLNYKLQYNLFKYNVVDIINISKKYHQLNTKCNFYLYNCLLFCIHFVQQMLLDV